MKKSTIIIIVEAVVIVVLGFSVVRQHHLSAAGFIKHESKASNQTHAATVHETQQPPGISWRRWKKRLSAAAGFWPSYAPKGRQFDDVFNDKIKKLMGGLEIVSLGTPYKEAPYPGVSCLTKSVPKWRNETIRLAVRRPSGQSLVFRRRTVGRPLTRRLNRCVKICCFSRKRLSQFFALS